MRILHISSHDVRGGAARSAHRLHAGLLKLGHESSLLVRHKHSDDPCVLEPDFDETKRAKRELARWKRIQRHYIDANRAEGADTKFSAPRPGFDVAAHPAVAAADVIHLHWVSGLLGPRGILRLQELGKPLVWTLHDQRPFTGGCHFSHGCRGFETDCPQCPQLASDPVRLTTAAVTDAVALIQPAVHVVAPSQWLAGCARQSALFRTCMVDVISYGIDTEVFHPRDREKTRADLGIDADATVFIFGAADLTERRKGFHLLAEMFAQAMKEAWFAESVRERRVAVLAFGDADASAFANLAVPVEALGRIDGDARLAGLYSAADVLLLPSTDDNLPNVLLEAMACGTGVIAHRVGGVPDVVSDGVHGKLAEAGNVKALNAAVLFAAQHREEVERWRAAARQKGAGYTLEAQARAYAAVYESLAKRHKQDGNAAVTTRSPLCDPGPNVQKILPELGAISAVRQRGRWLERWLPVFQARRAEP